MTVQSKIDEPIPLEESQIKHITLKETYIEKEALREVRIE